MFRVPEPKILNNTENSFSDDFKFSKRMKWLKVQLKRFNVGAEDSILKLDSKLKKPTNI